MSDGAQRGGAVEGNPCASAPTRSPSNAAGGGSCRGCRSRRAPAEPLLLVGPNGSGKSSLLRAVAGFLPLAAGTLALEGGAAEAGDRRAGALPRPRRRAEERAHRRRESRLLGRRARRRFRRARRGSRRSTGSASPMSPTSRRGRSPPARSAASRSPGSWSRRDRSGCSTSRPPRSTPPRSASSPLIMREHLAGGGLILAATHAPLDLDDAARLTLGEARGDGGGGVRRAAWGLFLREWRIANRIGGGASVGAVFFLILVTIMPFARRPRPRAAGADRSGDPVGGGAAGDVARSRPAVPGRP